MSTNLLSTLPAAQTIVWTGRTGLASSATTGFTITPTANANVLSSTGYSLTGSNAQSLVDLAGTWNTSGTPTLLKANITDTASNSSSLLLDLQVGGSSKFKVDKAGIGTFASALNATRITVSSDYLIIPNNTSAGVAIGGGGYFGGTGGTDGFYWKNNGGTATVRMNVATSDVWEQRNSTTAQKFMLFKTWTSGTNYESLILDATTSGAFTLEAAKGSSGSYRNLIMRAGGIDSLLIDATGRVILQNLPLSDPSIEGALWNNAGTVKISAG